MGYLHIENLYKNQKILQHSRCYALEKVHGTSAHIDWDDGKLTFFSGGAKHDAFVEIFDQDNLRLAFSGLGYPKITVYGEAYGGKMQGMKDTYGPDLRFIAFDVNVGGTSWLSVPSMDVVVKGLGLEVVPWEETSTDLATLNGLRDRPSEVASRRGCGNDRPREGVVLRPLEESAGGEHRLIAKHKIDRFGERKTSTRDIDPSKLVVLAEANAIANEWVTEERLEHVLAHLTVDGVEPEIKSMGTVIAAMIEDVYREGKDEVVESREAGSAIGRKTALLFKKRLQKGLESV